MLVECWLQVSGTCNCMGEIDRLRTEQRQLQSEIDTLRKENAKLVVCV
jgi:hypothetical protein